MTAILGLLGGLQTKLYIYGAVVLAALLALAGAYGKGRRAANRANERRALQSGFDTHRRISDAENTVSGDPAAAREWLRKRAGRR